MVNTCTHYGFLPLCTVFELGLGVLNFSLAFLNLSLGSRWSSSVCFILLGAAGGFLGAVFTFDVEVLVLGRGLCRWCGRLGGLLSIGTGVPGLLLVAVECRDGGVSADGLMSGRL